MKIVLERDISLASFRRLIGRSTLGSVYARFEGVMRFKVETEEAERISVTATLDRGAQVQAHDLIFGATGGLTVSRNKVAFNLGIEHVSIEFEPLSLHPISVHLPSVKVPAAGQKFEIEQELPALGLVGTAVLDIELFVEFLPDYRTLARLINARTARGLLLVTKSALCKVGGSLKAVVRVGRAALMAPFKLLGNSIGRHLAMDAMKLGSQTKALQKLAARLGKVVGVAGVFVETWMLAKGALPGLLGMTHKKVIDYVNPGFMNGYTTFLLEMTSGRHLPGDVFFDLTAKVQRMRSSPPDWFGAIERLTATGHASPPDKDAPGWSAVHMWVGAQVRSDTVVLAEASWEDLYREAYNVYFQLLDTVNTSSSGRRRETAWHILNIAHAQSSLAGMIAAYQDIVAFLATSSLYEDDRTGVQPTDVWEPWWQLAAFHHVVFGADDRQRRAQYLSLIDVSTLTVSIPPFGDFR